jgi:dipeptidase D
MELTETDFTFKASIRSSVVSAKEYIYDKIALLTESLGGNVSYVGDYPAWAYTRDSKLRDLCVDIFEKQYGKKPVIEIIHAGLECGILSSKIEGLDCISFGPDLLDIHTVSERMGISSVQRVWEYLKAILAAK